MRRFGLSILSVVLVILSVISSANAAPPSAQEIINAFQFDSGAYTVAVIATNAYNGSNLFGGSSSSVAVNKDGRTVFIYDANEIYQTFPGGFSERLLRFNFPPGFEGSDLEGIDFTEDGDLIVTLSLFGSGERYYPIVKVSGFNFTKTVCWDWKFISPDTGNDLYTASAGQFDTVVVYARLINCEQGWGSRLVASDFRLIGSLAQSYGNGLGIESAGYLHPQDDTPNIDGIDIGPGEHFDFILQTLVPQDNGTPIDSYHGGAMIQGPSICRQCSDYRGDYLFTIAVEPDYLDTEIFTQMATGYDYEVLGALRQVEGNTSVAIDLEGNNYHIEKLNNWKLIRTTPSGTTASIATFSQFTHNIIGPHFDSEGEMRLIWSFMKDGVMGYRRVRITGFTEVVSEMVTTPIFNPNGGTFTGSTSVVITSTPGADIRFTTDNSTPTTLSNLYTGPIPLTQSATIKAKAFKSGMLDSSVASASFTINTPPTSTGVTYDAADTSARSVHWRQAGVELHYWNAQEWLEYEVDFGVGGDWVFAITATNSNNSTAPGLPPGYAFNLAVRIDGAYAGALSVPGSTTAYQTGQKTFNVPAGTHTVRFTWTNDVWQANTYDANIRVQQVSFSP